MSMDRAWRKLEQGQHCWVPKWCCQLGFASLMECNLSPSANQPAYPPHSGSVLAQLPLAPLISLKTDAVLSVHGPALLVLLPAFAVLFVWDVPCSHRLSPLLFHIRCSTLFLVVDTSSCWWGCSPLTQALSITTASPSLSICSARHGASGRCSPKPIGRE